MRILFFGSKDRGILCLKELINYHEVVGIVTTKSKELTNIEQGDDLDSFAKKLNIPIEKPDDPNSDSVREYIKLLNADYIVLAGYGKMLKPEVYNIPKHGSINLHAGPLPNYRGAAPLNWMIINGEKKIAISIIQVAPSVDTGDILAIEKMEISETDTINTLAARVNSTYAKLLIETLKKLEDGSLKPIVQDKHEGFQMTRRYPKDGLILWDLIDAEKVHNIVRALQPPYPCAFTYYNSVKINILETEIIKRQFYGIPGRVAARLNNGFVVIAKDIGVLIKRAEANGNTNLKEILPPTGKDLLTMTNFLYNQIGN